MNAECRASNRVYSIRAAEVIADKRIRIRQEVNQHGGGDPLPYAEGTRGIQELM
jgi:hypothetical protein